MRPSLRTVVVVVIASALAWGAYTFWPSEERRVRRRIETLQSVLNERPTDGIGLVTRTAQLSGFFEDEVVFDPGRGAGRIHGRERLIALASRAPNAGQAFTVRFLDVSVSVDGDRAIVQMTATLTWTDGRGEENVDAREAELGMHKSDAWRISRITAVDAFERPPS